MTNVWVFEVGCKEYPPATASTVVLPQGVPERDARGIPCHNVPEQASVQSVAAVGYVTVAITMDNALQDQPAVACDCPGSHDSVTNVCIDFSEV